MKIAIMTAVGAALACACFGKDAPGVEELEAPASVGDLVLDYRTGGDPEGQVGIRVEFRMKEGLSPRRKTYFCIEGQKFGPENRFTFRKLVPQLAPPDQRGIRRAVHELEVHDAETRKSRILVFRTPQKIPIPGKP